MGQFSSLKQSSIWLKTLSNSELNILAPSESQIQKAYMQWVRLHPKLCPYIIHIPNEGKRTKWYGNELKDLGLRPGASDIFIAIPSGQYHGAWIEFKSKKGKLTKNQIAFHNDMDVQNYATKTVCSFDEAVEFTKFYVNSNLH